MVVVNDPAWEYLSKVFANLQGLKEEDPSRYDAFLIRHTFQRLERYTAIVNAMVALQSDQDALAKIEEEISREPSTDESSWRVETLRDLRRKPLEEVLERVRHVRHQNNLGIYQFLLPKKPDISRPKIIDPKDSDLQAYHTICDLLLERRQQEAENFSRIHNLTGKLLYEFLNISYLSSEESRKKIWSEWSKKIGYARNNSEFIVDIYQKLYQEIPASLIKEIFQQAFLEPTEPEAKIKAFVATLGLPEEEKVEKVEELCCAMAKIMTFYEAYEDKDVVAETPMVVGFDDVDKICDPMLNNESDMQWRFWLDLRHRAGQTLVAETNIEMAAAEMLTHDSFTSISWRNL